MKSHVSQKKRLRCTLEVLRDKDLMKQIRASKRYFGRGGKGLTFQQVFREPLPKRTGMRR